MGHNAAGFGLQNFASEGTHGQPHARTAVTLNILDEAGNRPPLAWTGRNAIDHNPGIRIGRPHLTNHDFADGEFIKQKLVISKLLILNDSMTVLRRMSNRTLSLLQLVLKLRPAALAPPIGPCWGGRSSQALDHRGVPQ